MYQGMGLTRVTDTCAHISFRHRDDWLAVVPGVLSYEGLVMGAETSGPLVNLIACEPAPFPLAPTHGHASDSFRLCIRGHQRQGRKSYGPGEFRFQEGWVPYAEEGFGDDGMWGIIALADRRGCRARPVDAELDASPGEQQFRIAQKARNESLGIEVDDMLSDNPDHTAGPSAVATTLGPLSNAGKLDGSFVDSAFWPMLGERTRGVVALLGDPASGPVFVLGATTAGDVAAPRTRFATEVARVVVAGGCTIGTRVYEPGDVRVDAAGGWCDEVIAGPGGLHELIVLADRRHVAPETSGPRGEASWTASLAGIVAELADELATRPPSLRVNRLAVRAG